jgi:hypothetical protein
MGQTEIRSESEPIQPFHKIKINKKKKEKEGVGGGGGGSGGGGCGLVSTVVVGQILIVVVS